MGNEHDLFLRLVRDSVKQRAEAEWHFREVLAVARSGGIPLGRLAEAAGLSTSRIHAILKREQNMTAGTASRDGEPTQPARDVLVVAAGRVAADHYLEYSAYTCQPFRSFRDVGRMGFYRNGQIEPYFPQIRYRKQDVEFTHEHAEMLRANGAQLDREVADLIDAMLSGGARPTGVRFQVFLLTPCGDRAQTLILDRPVKHRSLGRGTAWTQGTRYTSEEALRRQPETTDDLES